MTKKLSKKEETHIIMSQKWLNSFFIISSKHSAILDWKIDLWTLDLQKQVAYILQEWESDGITQRPIKSRDIETLKTIIKNRANKLFIASSTKQNKFINVNFSKNFSDPHAYTEIWDPGYLDMPALTFVSNGNDFALSQFEKLLQQFLIVDSDEKLKEFKTLVKKLYP